MTVRFAFSVESDGLPSNADLSSLDATTLRYGALLGGVSLRVDDAVLDAMWGWVPLLDFAASHREIAARLAASPGSAAEFEFTESEATLSYELRAGEVLVRSSWTTSVGVAGWEEFNRAVEDLASGVVQAALERHPELAAHPLLVSLASPAAAPVATPSPSVERGNHDEA